jgi:hypothetical protein
VDLARGRYVEQLEEARQVTDDGRQAESCLKEKGIALSVRGAKTGLPNGRLLADKTHAVSLFLSPRN